MVTIFEGELALEQSFHTFNGFGGGIKNETRHGKWTAEKLDGNIKMIEIGDMQKLAEG